MQRLLATSWRLARQNISKSQAVQANYYNRNVHEIHVKSGDLVYKYTPTNKVGQAAKFSHPWLGPFVVLDVRGPIAKLQAIRGKKHNSPQWIHMNMLKPCKASTSASYGEMWADKMGPSACAGPSSSHMLRSDITSSSQKNS